MPAAYAKALVSLNGGAYQSGAIYPAYSDVVRLAGESTVGWSAQIWEIVDYPPGWATPAGWTLNADTGVIFSTAVEPPAFTLPASTTWGKWMLRLRVNQATTANDAPLSLTDKQTAMSIPSDVDLRDTGGTEENQFGFGWHVDVKHNWRIISDFIAGGGGGGGGPPTGAAGGDLSGNYPNPNVARIRGVAIGTAAPGMVAGRVLRATGASAADWGALDLANASAITGLLPLANLTPSGTNGWWLKTVAGVAVWAVLAISTSDITPGTAGQILVTDAVPATTWATAAGDWTGAVTANVVGRIKGTAITTAGGTLPVGAVLRTTGGATADWGPVDLADSDAVTGLLAVAHVAPGANGQAVMTTGGVAVWGTVTAGSVAPGTDPQVYVTTAGPTAAWATAAGDWTGAVAANVVGRIKGTAVTTAGGSLPVGAVLRTTAGATADWGPVDLADNDAVTGLLAVGRIAPGSASQFIITLAGVAQWSSSFPVGSITPGTVGQWMVTIAGPTTAWETPAGDWDGAYSATTVRGLTGTGNVVAMHGTTILWDATLTAILKGADVTANGGTAPSFTVQASNETGTTSIGGALNLTSGTGTTANGAVNLQSGGITVLQLTDAAKITLFGTATLTSGTAVPSAAEVDGSLYPRTGGANGSLWGRENGAWVRYLSIGTLPPSAIQFQNVQAITDMTGLVVSGFLDGTWCWVRDVKRVYIIETDARTPSIAEDTYTSTGAGRIWIGQ